MHVPSSDFETGFELLWFGWRVITMQCTTRLKKKNADLENVATQIHSALHFAEHFVRTITPYEWCVLVQTNVVLSWS